MNLREHLNSAERLGKKIKLQGSFHIMGQGSLVIKRLPSKSFIRPETKKKETLREVSAPKIMTKMKTVQQKSRTIVLEQIQKRKDKSRVEKDVKKGKQESNKKETIKQYGQYVPLNLKKEKQLFFESQCTYNPVFLYSKFLSAEQQRKKGKLRVQFTGQFLDLAVKILEKGLARSYNKIVAQNVLTLDQFQGQVKSYIAKLGFQEFLDYKFVENSIVVAEVVYSRKREKGTVRFTMPIRWTPISYQGILNHEIGTHFLRTFNDKGQVWNGQRNKYRLEGFLQTEQGLAMINNVIHSVRQNQHKHPRDRKPVLMYQSALRYLACHLASRMSFCDLFRTIQKYSPDPIKRWNLCVRIKKGMTETVNPGGIYKIQVYFSGAVKVLMNRHKIDFRQFHSGKFSLNDYFRLKRRNLIKQNENTRYPHFLEDQKSYRKYLDALAAYNGID